MGILELSVADVGEAVAKVVIPSMTELGHPDEGLRVFNLFGDDLRHHVAGVHVNGADGHNFLAVSRRQVADQHVDQVIQLIDLKQNRLISVSNIVVFWHCNKGLCFKRL